MILLIILLILLAPLSWGGATRRARSREIRSDGRKRYSSSGIPIAYYNKNGEIKEK